MYHNPVYLRAYNPKRELKWERIAFNARTNAGGDWQAALMGSNIGYSQPLSTGITISATQVIDTNSAVGLTLNQLAGKYLATGGYVGRILSHTVGGVGGVTWALDGWFQPGLSSTTSMGTTSSTPSAGAYVVLPGQPPAIYIALSQTISAVNVADTSLAGEVTGSGLTRALATWSHTTVTGSGSTTNQTSYTLTHQWNSTGNVDIKGCGMLTALTGGLLVFENTFTDANLNNGDVLVISWQIDI